MVMSRWVGFEAAASGFFPPGLARSVRGIEQAGICRSVPQSQRFLGWCKVLTVDGATRRRNNSALRQVNPIKGSSMRTSNVFDKKLMTNQI